MSKKWNRFLSFLLAIALVFTTFGSDLASANVYAAEGEDKEAVETEAESLPEIFEEVTEEPEEEEADDAYVESTEDVEAAEEGSAGQTITNEEPAAPASEDAAVEDAGTAGTSEEDAAEASSEEDAAAEASSEEDAAAEASSEEEDVVKTVVEKKFAASTEIDGIKIELYAAPGVLPADAELVVEKVEAEKSAEIADAIDDQFANAKEVDTYSFDISIWSPSKDDYVQPGEGTVEVTFSEIEQAANKNVALAVHHVSDDLKKIEQVADAGKESTETEISFDTTHFSNHP